MAEDRYRVTLWVRLPRETPTGRTMNVQTVSDLVVEAVELQGDGAVTPYPPASVERVKVERLAR